MRKELSRRTLLAAAGAIPVLAMAEPASASAPRLVPAPPMRGADISFTLQEEAAGTVYRLDGRPMRLEHLLRAAGANWVRLRIWVNPPAGYSDLGQALRLGARAKRAGMRVLLDLHYSDFWADPGKQPIPAAWLGQDLATLATTVRDYTASVIAAFARRGIPADMVQIGNEVIAGMLWPVGQIYPGSTSSAGRSSRPSSRPAWPARGRPTRAGTRLRTMLHIDRGGDNGGSQWFFDHVLAQGVQFDVIGQSFYPFWHGPMAALSANLNDLAIRYGKPLVVVETAYPWTMADGDDLANSVSDPATLPDGAAYPPTPAGQAAYFAALRGILHDVPRGLGLGFFDWEPEWVPGVGWEPGAGNPNDNLTMFDFSGRALPSVRTAFRAEPQRT